MSRLNEQEKELLSIIEKVKGELTYYAIRYRNNGTIGLLLPGTDSAMQKGITLICCLENKTCAYNNNYTEKDPVPIYASHLPKTKMDLAGLSRYAKDKGVSVRDLSEKEKNRFGVFTQE